MAGIVATVTVVALLVRDRVAGDTTTSGLWGVGVLVGAATALAFSPLVDRVSRARAIEIGVLLSVTAFLGLRAFGILASADDPAQRVAVWNRSLLQFALVLGFYGLFVVNSGRRAALVMLPVAATPLLVAGVARIPSGELGSGAILLAIAYAVSVLAALMVGFLLHRMVEKTSETQYDMLQKIGAGGMGDVWLARHRSLARPAAIKLIRPDVINEDRSAAERTLRRFEREARTTAALRSPNTVEVYDFGVAGDGTFYYVMEFLDGWDLDALVRKHGPIAPERAVYLLAQVCESLADAHSQGLVHRDIKPANVHVSRMGTYCDFVKVLDFGLVKPEGDTGDGSQLSVDGGLTGTPAFISPEMATGGAKLDGRSDIYALGCVAYWMLTGKLVFDESSPVRMAVAHASVEPNPPSLHTELDIPEELDRIVLRCLAKDPADRFQSVRELRDALEACPTPGTWDRRRAERWWSGHRPVTLALAS